MRFGQASVDYDVFMSDATALCGRPRQGLVVERWLSWLCPVLGVSGAILVGMRTITGGALDWCLVSSVFGVFSVGTLMASGIIPCQARSWSVSLVWAESLALHSSSAFLTSDQT